MTAPASTKTLTKHQEKGGKPRRSQKMCGLKIQDVPASVSRYADSCSGCTPTPELWKRLSHLHTGIRAKSTFWVHKPPNWIICQLLTGAFNDFSSFCLFFFCLWCNKIMRIYFKQQNSFESGSKVQTCWLVCPFKATVGTMTKLLFGSQPMSPGDNSAVCLLILTSFLFAPRCKQSSLQRIL